MSDRQQLKAADTYEEGPIQAVSRDGDGYAITLWDGWLLWLHDDYGAGPHGIVPQVGDTIRIYGQGIGYIIRGIDVNGREAFYRTAAEQRAQDRHDAEQRKREKQSEFNLDRESYDRRVAALPQPFWPRFERFRSNNPEFRWEFEGYELFTCEQAVVIAQALQTVEAVRAFQAMDWDDQQRAVPGLSSDHSGNTFGCACFLARVYLEAPELLKEQHGALCPLVGCRGYGCVPVEGKSNA